MGSRGRPRVAATCQVCSHDDKNKLTEGVFVSRLNRMSDIEVLFVLFVRCSPGMNQHQLLSHLPPGPMGALNYPHKFLNNG